jgi:hypothetical protein
MDGNALEDGGSAVALGAGVGHQLKIEVAVLGGRVSRRAWDNGIGVNVGVKVLKAVGLLLRHLARTAREDASDARDVC